MPKKLFPKKLPEILYWGHGNRAYIKFHKHSFFQLEVVLSGYLCGQDETGAFTLGPGQCRLFPPEMLHGFTKNGGDLDYFSIKFRFPPFPVSYENTHITEALCKNIKNLLPESDSAETETLYLLAGQIYLLLFELQNNKLPDRQYPDFLRQISAVIEEYGYQTNINMLAERFSMTLSQLKYKFRKTNNSGFTSLKHFIDSILISSAQRHLTYSNAKIGEIASMLKFTDTHSFFRFFKNRTGMTPNTFRKNSSGKQK